MSKITVKPPKSFTVRAYRDGEVMESIEVYDIGDANLIASILENHYGQYNVSIQFHWEVIK